MERTIQLAVAALPLAPRSEMSPEDKHLPGKYMFSVKKSLNPALRANAVLDKFHQTEPVENLDYFAFVVYNPKTHVVIPAADDVESYTQGDHAFNNEDFTPARLKLFSFTVKNTGKLLSVVAPNQVYAKFYAKVAVAAELKIPERKVRLERV